MMEMDLLEVGALVAKFLVPVITAAAAWHKFRQRRDGPLLTTFVRGQLDSFAKLTALEKDALRGADLLKSVEGAINSLASTRSIRRDLYPSIVGFAVAAINHSKSSITDEYALRWIYQILIANESDTAVGRLSRSFRNLLDRAAWWRRKPGGQERLDMIHAYSALKRKMAFYSRSVQPNCAEAFTECTEHLFRLSNFVRKGERVVSYWTFEEMYVRVSFTMKDEAIEIITDHFDIAARPQRRPFGSLDRLLNVLLDMQLNAHLSGKSDAGNRLIDGMHHLLCFLDEALSSESDSSIVQPFKSNAVTKVALRIAIRRCESRVHNNKDGEAAALWRSYFSDDATEKEVARKLAAHHQAEVAIFYRTRFLVFLDQHDFKQYRELCEKHRLSLEIERLNAIESQGLARLVRYERHIRKGTRFLEHRLIDWIYGIALSDEGAKASPIRILYIIPSTRRTMLGGAETAFADMVERVAAAGYEVTVWAGGAEALDVVESEVRVGGITYWLFPEFVRYYERSDIDSATVERLGLKLRDGRFDILHACSFSALELVSQLVERDSYKVAFSYFETPRIERGGARYPSVPNPWKTIEGMDLRHLIDSIVDVVVPFSGVYENWLRSTLNINLPMRRACHILDRKRIERLRAKALEAQRRVPCRYVFVCTRIVPRKGLELLLDVVEEIVRSGKCSDIRFIVSAANFGHGFHGDYVERLLETILVRRLASYVEVIREELSDEAVFGLYAYSEFTVMPSIHEGYGIVPLESQLCGKPIVAFAIPGWEETIRHYSSGILVDLFDVSEMARIVAMLWTDSRQTRDLGVCAEAWVNRYLASLETDDAYLKILAELHRTEK
jgi:glycosyltransferase involved in cell wall biosynthesis